MYEKLKERLLRDGVIKHVALWNHNVEFIEQETAWERPAVFVEFEPVEWRCVVPGKEYHAEVRVRLHLVYAWSGDDASGFDLLDKVHNSVANLEGESFSPLEPLEIRTNHNHEEIVEDIVTYSCQSAMFLR